MQQLINARCPTSTGTTLIPCYPGQSSSVVTLARHSEREHTATNERARRQQYQQIATRGQRVVSFLFDVEADCRHNE